MVAATCCMRSSMHCMGPAVASLRYKTQSSQSADDCCERYPPRSDPAGVTLACTGLHSTCSCVCVCACVWLQVTKKGKAIVHRAGVAPRPLVSMSLSHDRAKDTPIPASEPHPLLQKIGLQTEDGRIRAHMQVRQRRGGLGWAQSPPPPTDPSILSSPRACTGTERRCSAD